MNRYVPVHLLNDDYIMDFVTEILKQFLENPPEDAEAVMLKSHEEGKGVAGTYPMKLQNKSN